MDLNQRKGISKIIPSENEKATKYLERVEENKEYYVPYSVSYLSDYNIKYYTKNNICQIALEYEVPNGEETTKQRIVLATAPIAKGATTQPEVQSTIEGIVTEITEFSSKRNFIEQIAGIQSLGWQVTNEGIDIMQVLKHDRPTEIKRTKFTQDERQTIKPEDIEENRETHYARLEEEFIGDIESYIVNGYKDLEQDSLDEDTKKRKQEVLEYWNGKKKGEIDPSKLLPAIFSTMRPMAESKINNLMENVYSKKLNEYISKIPEDEIEGLPKEKEVIEQYLKQRQEYAKTRDNAKDNNGMKNAGVNYRSTVMDIEAFVETKRQLKREETRGEVNRYLGIGKEEKEEYVEEHIEDEIEIG